MSMWTLVDKGTSHPSHYSTVETKGSEVWVWRIEAS